MRGAAYLRNLLRAAMPTRPWAGFAPPDQLDRAQFARDLQRPAPKLQYVIYFTPRSGSSWLADNLSRTKRMGRVTESFNPNFMPKMSQVMNAANLDDYCAMLDRRMQRGRVAGFQITYLQMRAGFGRERMFASRYGQCPSIWLIRRDLVLQAVSLYKMATASIAHSPHISAEAIRRSDAKLRYDAKSIRYWLDHVRQIEQLTEAFFARYGLNPLRLAYEDNIARGADATLRKIAAHIGTDLPSDLCISSPHTKLGTDKSMDFAQRFRHENPVLIHRQEQARARMLAHLNE